MAGKKEKKNKWKWTIIDTAGFENIMKDITDESSKPVGKKKYPKKARKLSSVVVVRDLNEVFDGGGTHVGKKKKVKDDNDVLTIPATHFGQWDLPSK